MKNHKQAIKLKSDKRLWRYMPAALSESSSKMVIGFAAVIVIVSVSALLTARAVTTNNQAVEQARLAKIAGARSINDNNLAAKKLSQQVRTDNQSVTNSPTGQAPPVAGANPKSTPTTVKKYATSSDPRSTAYSTTPPTPSPASFTTKITHNGQLSAGSAVYYNATKGEKGFYGGDLVLSTPSVTISKSNSASSAKNITVTVPDGETIGMPTSPWDDHSPYFFIAINNVKSSGTTFDMFVDSYGEPPLGSYQLHIGAGRTAQTTDGWQYDAFITVNVVE